MRRARRMGRGAGRSRRRRASQRSSSQRRAQAPRPARINKTGSGALRMSLSIRSSNMPTPADSPDTIVAATRHWLTRAVIGLNLCPFAKSVHVKQQIRFAISEAVNMQGVLTDLEAELNRLAQADPERIDTTLVIVPRALADFLDFNDCLFFADRLLKQMHLEGVLQIASFHPLYQFEGSE